MDGGREGGREGSVEVQSTNTRQKVSTILCSHPITAVCPRKGGRGGRREGGREGRTEGRREGGRESEYIF